MPDNPIVSIITPSFNRENLISETLDSVLAQTFSFWEALVVDDGSVDKTCEIVEAYSAKDSRIKLLKRDRPPKTASVCRNIGIENARGKYIIFLDSDDLLAPFCLEKRVNYMNSHPELDFAVFQMIYFNAKGFIPNSRVVKKKDNYLYAYLRHDLPWNITCPFWTTSFIRNHLKGYNETYPRLQDPEFNTRALMAENVKFDVLNETAEDCYCRDHWDKVFNINIVLNGFNLYIEDFAERIKKMPDYRECKHQLKYGYIEAVRGFYSYYKPQDHNESIKTITDIAKFAFKDDLINAYTYCLTRLLILLYKLRVVNWSKGKYILRAIMKLIKIS